mmetsp:Transcript_3138/g.7150  ORF Transcript_3138/g.7150 Transcript_3138/m.7150 type:complete len:213 (-) Transcript_3138:165-803(-)|eukprot:CAMPEP_0113462358 /NCGR_PEP_ID=MMETSP0014_2-20120614/12046_1 /TAXON_ID=2857 /ORGANISM="Nitzschia sp." /LENGTH=212 /DNA_ID=CAMNT_0000354209 /DNA_START=209 /DNA_END=847 /DNA_ORIENTATION=- /assembly_acc=CAM_ASM_000159
MSKNSSTLTSSRIIVKGVDYADEVQGRLLVELLDGYAKDPLGGSEPLREDVKRHLPSRLAQIPHAFSFIAYHCNDSNDSSGSGGNDDRGGDSPHHHEHGPPGHEPEPEPAGLINCFEGFSTFAARPLVNIHDVFVLREFRGNGISQALLRAVEDEALRRNCCKVTLECLSKNEVAIMAYRKSGFASYELGDPTVNGVAIFMEKKLVSSTSSK